MSTVSSRGVSNIAPYSFFNVVSGSPPVVMVSVDQRRDGVPKDSLVNATETGEFVVNLAGERNAESLNETSAEWEHGVSEFAEVGLPTLPAHDVKPLLVADAVAALECRVSRIIPVPDSTSTILLGSVLRVHVRDDLIADDGLPEAERLRPIARLGRNEYATLGRVFQLDRPGRAPEERS